MALNPKRDQALSQAERLHRRADARSAPGGCHTRLLGWGGEPILGEKVGGQLRRHGDEVRGLEFSAQIPPGDSGASVEKRFRRPQIRANIVGHEVVRGDYGNAAPARLRECVAPDDEVCLCVNDIGLKSVEEAGQLRFRLPRHADGQVGCRSHRCEVMRWTVTPSSVLTEALPVAEGQAT